DTRDPNMRTKKPGKTTMQEAQLIGRGARYYAFEDPNKSGKNGVRKYDDDMDNPLRVIEKLHYHSQHNPRYIQELHSALVETGIIAEQYVEVDENLILELQEDFCEERLLLVDGNNITPEKQQHLNSLESPNNDYRAVFAVDMLNEGWDVLNLFDIVRLYDTRDAKGNKPGKTTMQEAQLIGRLSLIFCGYAGFHQFHHACSYPSQQEFF
ncbi:MAG: hypothetical protein IIU21_07635, partial [Schwartzia sp.]|nr:hypothetical protein [Schwartzia sp. (in: firmicutes)]